MNGEFEKLIQKRKKWVEANQENGFDEGIKRLLTDLYPDNAHFIYELLQNAEDADASTVYFTLNNESLEFKHDGRRLFSLKDVDSITSIGVSTKRDDPTSIGKFGVGFKAVFAYTNTPEVHSGEFHFRIDDLVVPVSGNMGGPNSDDGKTRFIFPFNNPKKPSLRAKEEIQRGLLGLSDNTLLFLNNIRFIEYILPDGSSGHLSRFNEEGKRIQIFNIHPRNSSHSHWLHFQKDVEVMDDDDKPKTCRIAIAYKLAEEESKKSGEMIWKVVPLDSGQVSIYFPAEKETSNLRFHLHAPFASTVARDSVRDCKANQQLRDRVAELVVESLTGIRDEGLLTVSFLAVLPNPVDNLPIFYEPIRKAIVHAFQNDVLTPTRSGNHALATGLYFGPARIAEVLGDDDLSLLTNYAPPLWAANPPQQNQREDRFLESLEIDSWGWSELVDSIGSLDNDEERERIENWISKKEDAWLMRFYALLGEACDVHGQFLEADDVKIVRVIANNDDEHVKPNEAFFPSDEEISSPSDISFVKPTVYAIGRSEAQKKYARSFLENINVRTFDAKTSIELRLARYDNPPSQVDDSYYEDLKLFLSYWARSQKYWSMYSEETNLFKRKTILLGSADGKKLYWLSAESLCLDKPYIETGLAELSHIHRKWPVWNGYQDKLTKGQLMDFLDFIRATGVMTGLKVESSKIWNNKYIQHLWRDLSNGVRETSTSIQEDYTISNIDNYLKKRSIPCARLIWNTLIKSEAKVAKARYRPNTAHPIREADSQLVHALKIHAWIPNKKGIFCYPQDITRDELRDDFPCDNGNGLLTAIGLGESAKRRDDEFQAKNQKAREFGFESADKAAKWAELDRLGISPDEMLAQHKRIEQPESSVPNPERRRNGVLERGGNAPTKESITRERTIQPGIARAVAEAKAYLRPNYTNSNAELVCQCCREEMPFKTGDAYYFEAVQCVRGLNKHHLENRLALCPTCAAMYQHARQTDDAEIRRRLVDHNTPDNAPSVEIPVTLAGKEYRVRFVGKHWFDLKTILDL